MYLRVLFGFEYGMYCPVFRSSVISKKFTTFLFASTVILRLFWRKILQMSFFIHSILRGASLKIPRPSSRHSPTALPYFG